MNLNMDDIEKAIREAEASGDLPTIPDAQGDQQEFSATSPSDDSGGFGSNVDMPQDAERLSVEFVNGPNGSLNTQLTPTVAGQDEIVQLLRELVDVCRRGFGY